MMILWPPIDLNQHGKASHLDLVIRLLDYQEKEKQQKRAKNSLQKKYINMFSFSINLTKFIKQVQKKHF